MRAMMSKVDDTRYFRTCHRIPGYVFGRPTEEYAGLWAMNEAARILAETEKDLLPDGDYYGPLTGAQYVDSHGEFAALLPSEAERLAASLSALDSLPASEWASALVVG